MRIHSKVVKPSGEGVKKGGAASSPAPPSPPGSAPTVGAPSGEAPHVRGTHDETPDDGGDIAGQPPTPWARSAATTDEQREGS
jgi:hypothetical protein